MTTNDSPAFDFEDPQPHAPLAALLRPQQLDDVLGQRHLLADNKPIAQIIKQQSAISMILWGPPGTGKTTLAELIATTSQSHIVRISAVTDGVKEIRHAIEQAKQRQAMQQRTLVFVDEVHRFNKSQQDAFLPHIESGLIQFIGATTENPAFSLNNALLSRARVFVLKTLDDIDLQQLIDRALARLSGSNRVTATDKARTALIRMSAGDGRRLLTQLELAAQLCEGSEITVEHVTQSSGENVQLFDKNGDHLYDHLSAFHKSVRGSSVDGALFYFARLLQSGCEATVIARRLLAIASEDIGNADPRAIDICLSSWDVFHRVGAAEGERAIAQAIVYCALAPKSNAVYNAFKAAKRAAADFAHAPVPNHLRNAPTKLSQSMEHGKGYRYAHNEPHAYAAGESYLPDGVEGRFYQPQPRGLEKKLAEKQAFLASLDQQFADKDRS
ncbi:replication-associated recombination protein A [Alteromonas oceanisediminis]|uniref:replication-associated recombination protein A n=1 Tax=Alteromonas oceanisediminis TaxID=2836180 RepID=UPI001BDB3778|nr:replication-associated recombination protein A [Alteromonas oceanisediminis]MBT0586344.1 replication-associated recombination protein A [Alteromonas oceanisediminis]